MAEDRDTELGFLARIADSLDELTAAAAHPRGSGPTIHHAKIRQTFAGASEAVVVPAGTRRIVVVGIRLGNDEAAAVGWKIGNVEVDGPMPLAANGGYESWGTREEPVLPSLRGEDLIVTVDGATTLGGIVAYFED